MFGLILAIILGGLSTFALLQRRVFLSYAFFAMSALGAAVLFSGGLAPLLATWPPVVTSGFHLAALWLLVLATTALAKHYFAANTANEALHRHLAQTNRLALCVVVGAGVLASWAELRWEVRIHPAYFVAPWFAVVLFRAVSRLRPHRTLFLFFILAFALQGVAMIRIALQGIGVLNAVEWGVPPLYVSTAGQMMLLLFGTVASAKPQFQLPPQLESEIRELFEAEGFIKGSEAEKIQIAMELHDDALAELAALQHAPIEDWKAVLSRVTKRIRTLSHTLHPLDQGAVRLADRMKKLACDNATSGQATEFHCDELPPHLPSRVEFEMYRIGQEALRNIHVHAQATHVFISLLWNDMDETLTLIIEDNGVGFEPGPQDEGIGLHNIAHRSRIIGAELEVDSEPGRGTLILVRVPIRPTSPAATLLTYAPMAEPK